MTNRINLRLKNKIDEVGAKRLSQSKKDRFLHFSIIIIPGKKGNVFTGTNRYTEHFGRGRHAEVNVLKKLLSHQTGKNKNKNKRKKKIDLIVCRITKEGNLTSSKPCYHCLCYMNQIHSFRINRIYYSTSQNIIVCDTFKNLFNENYDKRHISAGNNSGNSARLNQ